MEIESPSNNRKIRSESTIKQILNKALKSQRNIADNFRSTHLKNYFQQAIKTLEHLTINYHNMKSTEILWEAM